MELKHVTSLNAPRGYNLCLQLVYAFHDTSVVCLEDGMAIYKVDTLVVTAIVCLYPFRWVRAIVVDLDGSIRDASMLQVMATCTAWLGAVVVHWPLLVITSCMYLQPQRDGMGSP